VISHERESNKSVLDTQWLRELLPQLNLLLNVITLVVVVALAVWLRNSHIQVVELKGQLLGMVMSLRLMINGRSSSEEPPGGPVDPQA